MGLTDYEWTDESPFDGGFATVRFAVRRSDGVRAAVKFLRGENSMHPKLVERFLREIETLVGVGQFGHPGVLRTLDYSLDTQSSLPYVALERCTDTFQGRKSDYLEPIHCAESVASLCDGLSVLHDRYYISHRDIKLANLFIREDRSVCLGDLGSRLSADDPFRITEKGQLYPGTLEYRAPECFRYGAQPESIFMAADVYSMGVVLYELLTGQVPFPVRNPTNWQAYAGIVERDNPKLARSIRLDLAT